MRCGCDTSYIVSVHIQCQPSIYTLPLCRGHSWRVWLAMQETLTPPGQLVSPLVCRGPWMSIVVLYWCHSDSASVLLYFTFLSHLFLCRVELVVQFPARGSTRVFLCLFPGALWLWHFLYSVGPHPVSNRRRWLLPGTWSHLWFAGVRECPSWCSIVGATVTVHQFYCILHNRALLYRSIPNLVLHKRLYTHI